MFSRVPCIENNRVFIDVAFWNIINVRNIVLDYSHLSQDNYAFLVEFGSDSYFARRLGDLTKAQLVAIHQKNEESGCGYDLATVVGWYSALKMLIKEEMFAHLLSYDLPKCGSYIRDDDYKILFTKKNKEINFFSTVIDFKNTIDLTIFLDEKTRQFSEKYDIFLSNVSSLQLTPSWSTFDDEQQFVTGKFKLHAYSSMMLLDTKHKKITIKHANIVSKEKVFNSVDIPLTTSKCVVEFNPHLIDCNLVLQDPRDVVIEIDADEEQCVNIVNRKCNIDTRIEINGGKIQWFHMPLKITKIDLDFIEKCFQHSHRVEDFEKGKWINIDLKKTLLCFY